MKNHLMEFLLNKNKTIHSFTISVMKNQTYCSIARNHLEFSRALTGSIPSLFASNTLL